MRGPCSGQSPGSRPKRRQTPACRPHSGASHRVAGHDVVRNGIYQWQTSHEDAPHSGRFPEAVCQRKKRGETSVGSRRQFADTREQRSSALEAAASWRLISTVGRSAVCVPNALPDATGCNSGSGNARRGANGLGVPRAWRTAKACRTRPGHRRASPSSRGLLVASERQPLRLGKLPHVPKASGLQTITGRLGRCEHRRRGAGR